MMPKLNNGFMEILETPLYYDQPEYDEFWQTLTELDVPLYLHPRVDIDPILSFQYGHATWLVGPAQQFTATLSGHILGSGTRPSVNPSFTNPFV